MIKRMLDIVVAITLLIVLFPIGAIITCLIKWQLGNPIFFVQKRPGLKGEPFYLYKFRTMSHITDADGELLEDAKRLTTFGRLLRNTSLDELPQLWNVVRGELSIVGPRPLLMEYLPLYSTEQMRSMM
ncbi:lipid carrier [Halalkalibacter hemicellulosilyticusJCM 9152]|uniref:Lipid carrier n=1 Tax=Halalkalibacter hemicellulosilyticusJCM 9152 TaxID=1236971 RepID=W4QDK8_9BACI|nr:lipid carrier [Halalkalibacter hemicellulosilyticusJCM 9152]